ncbi:MAG: hypothetical protein RMJ98_08785 [Myxococcales bacterium]|nr:hypothetical protein [Polyangiaceae bacterium]MDW8249384.1 hypothetical protein [Myxococcales bacterium]
MKTEKKLSTWIWVLVALSASLFGCGKGALPPSDPSSRASAVESAPPSAGEGHADASMYQPAAPPVAGEAYHKEDAPNRPGLATHWGETRTSYIRSTTFYRADFEHPSAIATLWYNDAEGARAQAAVEGYQRSERGELGMAQSGILLSLRDEYGRVLPGYQVRDKTFAIGEAGSRYTVWLENRTPARFEVVVSVDGLDVIDGKPASFSKRGYILNPHASLEIEGFRQSESTVASFRFGSVRGSYAARKGDDRNVGVIGVAVFHERGFPMWPWDPQEIERRRKANPFPGQFATPPP